MFWIYFSPSPVAPPPPLGVISSRLSLANLALSEPKWPAVALFFCVLAIWNCSIEKICINENETEIFEQNRSDVRTEGERNRK